MAIDKRVWTRTYTLDIRFDDNMPDAIGGFISAARGRVAITINGRADRTDQLCSFLHECVHLFRNDLDGTEEDAATIEAETGRDLKAACTRILTGARFESDNLTNRLMQIAKAEGLDIEYKQLQANDGFIKGKTVVLSEDIRGTDQEQRILAHELAHWYLHHGRDLVTYPDAEAEQQADDFGDALIAVLGLTDKYPEDNIHVGMIRALTGLLEDTQGAK